MREIDKNRANKSRFPSGFHKHRTRQGKVATTLRARATGHFVQPHVAAHCGGDIYSRRKPLFSSFGEHTAVCGSSVRQAVARPRHRQSVCIHNIHVAATCRPSVPATMRGHMWLNKVASVLGPLLQMASFSQPEQLPYLFHCTMGSKITNQSS